MGSKQHREKAAAPKRVTRNKERRVTVVGQSTWPELGVEGHRVVLRHSWGVVSERGMEGFVDRLYELVLKKDPGARQLLGSGLHSLKRVFPTALYSVLDNKEAVKNLAVYHAHVNITPHQVRLFCHCILEAMFDTLAENAIETVRQAWTTLLTTFETLFVTHLNEAKRALKGIDGGNTLEVPRHISRRPAVPVTYSGWLRQAKALHTHHTTTAPRNKYTTVDRSSRLSLHSPGHQRFNSRVGNPPPPPPVHPATWLPKHTKFVPHKSAHVSYHTRPTPPPLHEEWNPSYRYKPRWLEVKGQYLFYYSHQGDKPLGLVDLSSAEVVDESELSYAFSLRSGGVFGEVVTFVAEGDNDKEDWVVQLKKACRRFSFTRPFAIGQRVTVDGVTGTCMWLGSVEGTPLAWKAEGLWVGVECDTPQRDGHDGKLRGKRYFTCANRCGVLVPAFKVTASGSDSDSDTATITHRPQDFDFLAILGKGSFGSVYKVREKTTGRIFACKVLQKAALIKENQVHNLHRERSILFTLSHPYIVRLHAAFQTKTKLLLLFDFLSGGELWYHMAYRNGVKCDFTRFSEDRAKFYLAEVSLAVGYLHTTMNVIHRDLKLENLVLDSDGHVVLTDFGFAKTIDHDDAATAQCGTIPYMAPEVLQRVAYGFEVDWWSLGVVLFIMVTGCYPYWVSKSDGSLDPDATITQILSGRDVGKGTFPDPAALSAPVQDLICKLLDKDPRGRLSNLAALQSHPFFSGFNWAKCASRGLEPPFIPSDKGPNTKYFYDIQDSGLSHVVAPSRHGEDDRTEHFEHFSTARRAASTVSEADYDLENLSYLESDQFIFEADT